MSSTPFPMRTERLTLRFVAPGEGHTITAYRNDPAVSALQSWDLPYPLDRAHGSPTSSPDAGTRSRSSATASSSRSRRPTADLGGRANPPLAGTLLPELAQCVFIKAWMAKHPDYQSLAY